MWTLFLFTMFLMKGCLILMCLVLAADAVFGKLYSPLAILTDFSEVQSHAQTDEYLHLSQKYNLLRDLVQRHLFRVQCRQGSDLLRPWVPRNRSITQKHRTPVNRAPAADAGAMIRADHR